MDKVAVQKWLEQRYKKYPELLKTALETEKRFLEKEQPKLPKSHFANNGGRVFKY